MSFRAKAQGTMHIFYAHGINNESAAAKAVTSNAGVSELPALKPFFNISASAFARPPIQAEYSSAHGFAEALGSLETRPEDVIVIYYKGRAVRSTGPVPNLVFYPDTNSDGILSPSAMFGCVKTKAYKTCILLLDACEGNYSQYILPAQQANSIEAKAAAYLEKVLGKKKSKPETSIGPGASAPAAPALQAVSQDVPAMNRENISALLGSRKNVVLLSSAPGQDSYTCARGPGFSHTFGKILQSRIKSGDTLSWPGIIHEVNDSLPNAARPGDTLQAAQTAYAPEGRELGRYFVPDSALKPGPSVVYGDSTKLPQPGKYYKPGYWDVYGEERQGLIRTVYNRRWYLCNALGQVLYTLNNYAYVFDFSEGMARVYDGKSYGYINTLGKEVIAPRYFSAGSFSQGLAAVGNLYFAGYVNKEGKEHIPLVYSKVLRFTDGLGRVSKYNKFGFVNPDGKEVIPVEYDHAYQINDGYVWLEKKGKFGLADRNGNLLTAIEYDSAGYFEDGLAMIAQNGLIGKADTKGNIVVPIKYRKMGSFRNGLAWFQRDSLFGYINVKGEELIPNIYNAAYSFRNGLARVKKDKAYIVIDTLGNPVKHIALDLLGNKYTYGLAIAGNNGLYGYVDTMGNIKVPIQFTYEEPYQNGLALVCKGNSCGYINRRGFDVIPMRYHKSYVRRFSEGLVVLTNGHFWGVFDTNGVQVVPFKYREISNFSNGTATVLSGSFFGGYGVIDKTGKEIIPCEYNDVQHAPLGTFCVKGTWSWYIINRRNERVKVDKNKTLGFKPDKRAYHARVWAGVAIGLVAGLASGLAQLISH
ncbi:MAG: WG repeat-containing protein [Bacteroidota bacterium]